MAQNSTETADVLDIDALMNSQMGEKDVSAVVTSLSGSLDPSAALKRETNALSDGSALVATPTPTSAQNGGRDTAVEVIDLTRPVKTAGEASPGGSTTMAASTAIVPIQNSSSVRALAAQSPSTPDGLAASAPFGSPLTSLGAQLKLTHEEQALAYKKANILALSALAKKGGPNAKEMLAVQAKLQEFLTSLITLAGNSGPHLKLTVQLLVQRLVTGAISEEEFALRIESDLRSQHQPSLLPFLKNSVPHLKTRLQLQQAIMKELLQRQAAEKAQSRLQQQQQQSPQASTPPLQQQTAPVKQNDLQQTLLKPQTPQEQRRLSEPINLSPAQPQTLQPQQKPQHGAPVSIPTTSSAPVSSQPSAQSNPLLAQLTPEQQKFLYMHQLRRQQFLKQQQQQTQQQNTANTTQRSRSASPQVNQLAATTANPTSVANLQTVLEKQQQLVKEQQIPLIMGGKMPLQAAAKIATQPADVTPFGSILAKGVSGAGSSGQSSSSTGGRTSFADLNLSTMRVPSPSSGGSVQHHTSRGKSKAKGSASKGKDGADAQDDEEEEEGMDIAGVNLQEETAHFLPPTVGETVTRTCKDETLLQLPALRQRVTSIARLYGITEVSEDFLVLLSHATQERLRDITEKLTVISQHRTGALRDDRHYEVSSEVRGQLKVLESIDRINHKRKQEREKEKILRAAKSRSKGDDPEMAAKIKEQAKQLQMEEEQMIRNKAANATALAAIGRRKRALQQDSTVPGSSPQSGSDAGSSSGQSSMASLFGSPSLSRQHKRRITTRDLVFYMEQERETRKSLLLYKSLLK